MPATRDCGILSAEIYLSHQVHTANDWEHAHLEGGDERKQKFLRLMGAGKVNTECPKLG